MRIRVRKIILFAVAAALAVANGVAPRHAQAGMHPHAVPIVEAKHHPHESVPAAHHHHAAAADQLAATPICHGEGQGDAQQKEPDHNCCVASCSAVAFIFASFNFGNPLPRADYGVSLPVLLTPASLTSADPPPR